MTKYNNKKVVFNGITFDSKMECDYYKMLLQDENVKEIIMQPEIELLSEYTINSKKIRGVKYKPDFIVVYKDETRKVIDIKGFETADFKLKKKIFESKYLVKLHCITYSKIDGGWIEIDELKKARAKRKKAKEQKLR